MSGVANCFEGGHGVGRDYAMAMQWYQTAANAGDTSALDSIGKMFRDGHGVVRDSAYPCQPSLLDCLELLGRQEVTVFLRGKTYRPNGARLPFATVSRLQACPI
jgi:hypothetical protein